MHSCSLVTHLSLLQSLFLALPDLLLVSQFVVHFVHIHTSVSSSSWQTPEQSVVPGSSFEKTVDYFSSAARHAQTRLFRNPFQPPFIEPTIDYIRGCLRFFLCFFSHFHHSLFFVPVSRSAGTSGIIWLSESFHYFVHKVCGNMSEQSQSTNDSCSGVVPSSLSASLEDHFRVIRCFCICPAFFAVSGHQMVSFLSASALGELTMWNGFTFNYESGLEVSRQTKNSHDHRDRQGSGKTAEYLADMISWSFV